MAMRLKPLRVEEPQPLPAFKPAKTPNVGEPVKALPLQDRKTEARILYFVPPINLYVISPPMGELAIALPHKPSMTANAIFVMFFLISSLFLVTIV